MKVSDELLAAYAEGKVSDAERKAVREYLMQNPDELESVMMMMDKDFELTPTGEPLVNSNEILSSVGSMADICYSAAAFAPKCISKSISQPPKPELKKRAFKDRLDDFLDELNL